MDTRFPTRRFSREPFFWFILCGLLAIIGIALLFGILNYKSKSENAQRFQGTLTTEIEQLKSQLAITQQRTSKLVAARDHYKSLLATAQQSVGALDDEIDKAQTMIDHAKQQPLNGTSMAEFKQKGFLDPIAAITSDLRLHQELITVPGVLGGAMSFHEIYVLTHRWALAEFDDGHISGYMLLEYNVSDNGKISWKVIAVE